MAFSSQGDRIALTQIEQMIDGQYYKLGYYDTQADNLTWFNSEQWVGGKVNKLRLKPENFSILFLSLRGKLSRQEKFHDRFYKMMIIGKVRWSCHIMDFNLSTMQKKFSHCNTH